MVAAGDDARTARRAQCGRVHVAVAQAVRGQRVEAGGLDRAAVTAQLAEPGVIQHDEQHIRRALAGPYRGRPGRRGLLGGPTDHAGERGTRFVLDNRHPDLSLLAMCSSGTYPAVPWRSLPHPARMTPLRSRPDAAKAGDVVG